MMFLERILKRYSIKKILLIFADLMVLFVGTMITLSMRLEPDGLLHVSPFSNPSKFIQYMALNLIVIIFFRYFNLYKQRVYYNAMDQFIQIVKAILLSGLLLIVFDFFILEINLHKNARFNLVCYLAFNTLFIYTYRVISLKILVRSALYNQMLFRRIIAIGAGSVGESFATEIKSNSSYYLQLVGFLDDDGAKVGTTVAGAPVLGLSDEVDSLVEKYNIDEVFITIEDIGYDQLLKLVEQTKATGVQVNLVSSHFDIIERKVDVMEFKGLRSVPIFTQIMSFYARFLKRQFDIFVTSAILLIGSPVWILIALAVKFSSPGPIFYRSKVIGKNGEEFLWFKFRTMYANNDQGLHKEHLKKIITENKTTEKIKNDPRVTAVGRFLRKYSIDEFPQLLNVLLGDMSLIGPRPCLPYEYELMSPWQKRRTKVLPGMTGLWQISGRNKADVTFNDSIVLDLYYASNLSFWLDMKILLKTIPVVVFGKGGS